MSALRLTPWSRAALDTANVNRFVLAGRIPPGWSLSGFAGSPKGPWHFDARSPEGVVTSFTASRVQDVPTVLERALAHMGSDDLESALAVSLAARGETGG